MKILIDSRGASWYRGTGIGTYTHNLLKTLTKIDNQNEYHLFCASADYSEYKNNNAKTLLASKKHKTFFEDFYMPHYAKEKEINIYHVPQNGIGIHKNDNYLNIATIHDLIPYVLPETTGPGYLKNFIKKMPDIIESCDGILTVSEYSKKDILKFFPSFPSERIIVTPLAANKEFKLSNKNEDLKSVQTRFKFTGEFIMYIGGFSPRKNIEGLIRSFNSIYKKLKANTKLLIVGGLREEGLRLQELSKTLDAKDNIVFTGFLEEAYLPTIYSACSLFIYPSLYEGFGLPPLEAMSCGTPVLSSNSTSIPEVVQNSNLLFNPNISRELETKMIKILNNENLRKKYETEAINLSKYFSWENTAKLTLEAYETIYKLGKK